ncbi:MAG TPA: hypothetical protein VFC75_01245, partial [Erysipelothrix sp.]|nr:hypothetical protein [Erysipelothrix sp.]
MSRRRKIKGEDISQVEQIKRKIKHEKKRQQKARIKKVMKRVFSLILILIIGALILLFDRSKYSRIREVHIRGNTVVSKKTIAKHVRLKENDRLIKGFFKSLTTNAKVDGVANIKLKMYYTKGLVEVEVEEYPVVAIINGKKKGYLMSDNVVV